MKLIGASVLPYGICPQHNQIFFLLGSERILPNWHDSGKFSDFGGSTKYKNEPPPTCAAREFFEETCAAVAWNGDEVLNSYEGIEGDLRNEKYTLCLKTNIDQHKMYLTYVKQIKFDPKIPRHVSTITSNLLRIRNLVRLNGKYVFAESDAPVKDHPALKIEDGVCVGVSRDFLEKQQLVWVSISHAKLLIDGKLPENKHSHRYRKKIELRPAFEQRFRIIVAEFFNSIVRLNNSLKISSGDYKHVCPSNIAPKFGGTDNRECKQQREKQDGNFEHKSTEETDGQGLSTDTPEELGTAVCCNPPGPPKSTVQVQSTNVPNIGRIQIR